MSDEPLGRVGFDALVTTRLHLHHALQLVTSFAQASVDAMEDDRHRNFDWDIGVRGFRSRPATADPELTTVFAVEEFELRLERADTVVARIPCRGQGPAELRSTLATELERALGRSVSLVAPEFDLPDRPGDPDQPFDPDPVALAELAGWFTHGELALSRIHQAFEGVCDDIRVWPHHFDLGTLLHTDAGTIGLGLSPGDEGIPHPYWYVRGYPKDAPREGELPELPHGAWKFEGWTGAILEAPEIVSATDARAQGAMAAEFLDTVVATCVRLLG